MNDNGDVVGSYTPPAGLAVPAVWRAGVLTHVTHSSERLAAVEAVPHVHRQKFILRVLQRGYRFLKHFRQHIAPSRSLRQGSEQIRETSSENQHQSRRGIRV